MYTAEVFRVRQGILHITTVSSIAVKPQFWVYLCVYVRMSSVSTIVV